MADDGITSMGLRASPSAVHWAVVSGTQTAPELVDRGKLQPPPGHDAEAKALLWYRGQIIDLIGRTGATVVAIRYAETQGKIKAQVARQRARIEGVLLEAAASHGVTCYTGPLASIRSRLRTDGAKKYLESSSIRGIELPKGTEPKEAVLVAVSGLSGDNS